jgi:hypothetical protein
MKPMLTAENAMEIQTSNGLVHARMDLCRQVSSRGIIINNARHTAAASGVARVAGFTTAKLSSTDTKGAS